MDKRHTLDRYSVAELRTMAANYRSMASQAQGTGIAESFALIAAGFDRMADRREQDEQSCREC